MKIVTYNVNGIRARLPRLLEYLEEQKPDVACLQELKSADETFPAADIEAAGYGAVWHGQKGFNGVAILARGTEPKLRRMGLPGDPDDTHSRYIEAEVGGIVAASIYRSEEHTSELQSLMRISYAVFCLKKQKKQNNNHRT